MQVLPASNNFSTVVANLSDPLFEVAPLDYTVEYNLLVQVPDATPTTEGIVFCLGDACFSGNNDSAHYDIINFND